jgi:hypothetical protein
MSDLRAAPIAQMAQGGEYLRYQDGDPPTIQAHRVDFNRCEWMNVRMKASTFEECALTRCRFAHCYLRDTSFSRVDLTGSEFDDCDLTKATFTGSKLWYVTFFNCDLDYDALIEAAPREVNLRRRLLKSLRRNATQTGDSRMADRLLLLEMAARRLEERSIFLSSDRYFRENFTNEDRVRAFGRWIFHWVELLVWGYGVRLLALFRTAAIVIILAGALSSIGGATYQTSPDRVEPLSFGRSLYQALVTFSNAGDLQPSDNLARAIRAVLSLSGAVFLGLFAAAAYRRIEE